MPSSSLTLQRTISQRTPIHKWKDHRSAPINRFKRQTSMIKVAKNIFTETIFTGCNPSIVVTEEGIVLIDTPYLPTEALRWKGKLRKLGKVKYVINTENHADHVLGNYFFAGTIISHEGTKENFGVSLEKMGGILPRIQELDPEGVKYLKKYVPKEPKITFDQKLTLYVGDERFEMIHLPGHTANQIAVFMPEGKVIFTGDNVVYRTRPFYHECKPREWMRSLEYIKKMNFDVLIPGHGEVCGKEAIDEMISFNNEVFEQIKKAIKEGLSKEETVEKVVFSKKMPLKKYQREVGPMMDRMGIYRIYMEFIS